MLWFDILFFLLLFITLAKGFIAGLVMQAASLVGVIVGSIFAGKLAEIATPYLMHISTISPHTISIIAFFLAFIAIVVGFILLGKLLQSAIEAVKMNSFNRLAGALFCSTKWLIVASIILNLVVELDQNKRLLKTNVREQAHTYPILKQIAPTAVPYLRFEWLKKDSK